MQNLSATNYPHFWGWLKPYRAITQVSLWDPNCYILLQVSISLVSNKISVAQNCSNPNSEHWELAQILFEKFTINTSSTVTQQQIAGSISSMSTSSLNCHWISNHHPSDMGILDCTARSCHSQHTPWPKMDSFRGLGPMTKRKWWMTMVRMFPLSRGIPFPHGRFKAYKWWFLTK